MNRRGFLSILLGLPSVAKKLPAILSAPPVRRFVQPITPVLKTYWLQTPRVAQCISPAYEDALSRLLKGNPRNLNALAAEITPLSPEWFHRMATVEYEHAKKLSGMNTRT